MSEAYKTLKEYAETEYIIKKSKFLSYSKPVKTEEEAQEFIASIKQKHWDATHNVYAYCIREGNIKRFSDDGEVLQQKNYGHLSSMSIRRERSSL